MTGRMTRRGVLKFAGGMAAGIFVTPLPWTLLDDMAIWTQTRNGITKLPRGEVSTRFTTCALCPAACGVRLRCVAGVPFGIDGVAAHPASRGRLCPFGFAGHHLRHHPRRLVAPAWLDEGLAPRPVPVALAEIHDAVAGALARGGAAGASLVIVDARPGRALSALYRRIATEAGGLYVAMPAPEDAVAEALAGMSETPPGPLGWDLENTRFVLSFGAPVLEGWGGPGRLLDRRYGDGGPLGLVQIEPHPSRTALLADRWLRARPGTEMIVALSLANVLLREGLIDRAAVRARVIDLEAGAGPGFADRVARFTPEAAGRLCGVDPEALVATAREFARHAPAIAIVGGDLFAGPAGAGAAQAAAILNLLAGSVGTAGGLRPRRTIPGDIADERSAAGPAAVGDGGAALAALPAGSVRVLILDGEPTADAVRAPLSRALAPDAVVVSLSPYAIGSEGGARFIVPPPAWLESIQDVPTPPGAPRAALALAARVVEPPSGAVDPAAFIATLARTLRLGGAWPESTAALVSARLRAVAESGRGRVVRFSDGASVAPAAGADGLLKQLADGGLWVDDDLEAALPRCRLFGPRPERFERLIAQAAAAGETPSVPEAGAWPFALVPFRDPIAAAAGPLPALGSKLYRESGLRPAAGRALVHPLTARAAGCGEGSEVRIETPRGVVAARLTLDPAIAGDEIHLVLEPCPERMGEKVPEAAGSRCALWEGAGEGPAAPLRARLQRI